MWRLPAQSFLSIVDKGDPSGQTLVVRARHRGDIGAVFPDAQVTEGAGTDCRYRARIDRVRVALAMADQVRAVAYPNFKAAVRDDKRHDAYMSVWQAMFRLQDTERRR